jgi:hypothetical protein
VGGFAECQSQSVSGELKVVSLYYISGNEGIYFLPVYDIGEGSGSTSVCLYIAMNTV